MKHIISISLFIFCGVSQAADFQIFYSAYEKSNNVRQLYKNMNLNQSEIDKLTMDLRGNEALPSLKKVSNHEFYLGAQPDRLHMKLIDGPKRGVKVNGQLIVIQEGTTIEQYLLRVKAVLNKTKSYSVLFSLFVPSAHAALPAVLGGGIGAAVIYQVGMNAVRLCIRNIKCIRQVQARVLGRCGKSTKALLECANTVSDVIEKFVEGIAEYRERKKTQELLRRRTRAQHAQGGS